MNRRLIGNSKEIINKKKQKKRKINKSLSQQPSNQPFSINTVEI